MSLSPELAELNDDLVAATDRLAQIADDRIAIRDRANRAQAALDRLDERFVEARREVETLTTDLVARVKLEAGSS